jgi:hypothetical protein
MTNREEYAKFAEKHPNSVTIRAAVINHSVEDYIAGHTMNLVVVYEDNHGSVVFLDPYCGVADILNWDGNEPLAFKDNEDIKPFLSKCMLDFNIQDPAFTKIYKSLNFFDEHFEAPINFERYGVVEVE